MPTRAEQRQAFLALNPWCVFCGGAQQATTVEHCPPKALFQFKRWPEGFEFPACLSCNSGTGDQDAIVAMLARMHPDEGMGNADGRVSGLMLNVNAQFPGLVHKMVPSHIEARRRNRALGLKPGPGQLHIDIAPFTIPAEMQTAVCTFARKLSKAIYYRETKRAFPESGVIIMRWFTNVELLRNEEYPVFERMKLFAGDSPPLVRGGKYLNEQFEFKLSLSHDQHVFVLQVRIGKSFGMVIFASVTPGVIEPAMEQLREKYRSNGPFSVIQGANVA